MTHKKLAWASAVKIWNQQNAWADDMYALPKKSGQYYQDIVEIIAEHGGGAPMPVIQEPKKFETPISTKKPPMASLQSGFYTQEKYLEAIGNVPVIEPVVPTQTAKPVTDEFEEKKQKAIQEVLEYDAEKAIKSAGVKNSSGFKLNWHQYGKSLPDEKKVYYLKQMITDLEKDKEERSSGSYKSYEQRLEEMKNSKNLTELTEAKKSAIFIKGDPFIYIETIRRRKEALEKLEKKIASNNN